MKWWTFKKSCDKLPDVDNSLKIAQVNDSLDVPW
jgi:hypothetical protein